MIGVLYKTLAWPTVTRSVSAWGATLSPVLWITAHNTPVRTAAGETFLSHVIRPSPNDNMVSRGKGGAEFPKSRWMSGVGRCRQGPPLSRQQC
jgi:hypothetical protein